MTSQFFHTLKTLSLLSIHSSLADFGHQDWAGEKAGLRDLPPVRPNPFASHTLAAPRIYCPLYSSKGLQ